MRRLPQLSLTFIATLALSQSLSMTAFAADQNSYRPGQAYLKAAATSHEACAQQCQGDAQCRGWNFVRPNPRAASGICEFNARVASPVSSAISISGEVVTSVDPLMSRAIPAGARTRRVGTPTIEKRKPVPTQNRGTRVKRMPVPAQQKSTQPISHTRPAAQNPNARQSRVYGNSAQPGSNMQKAPAQNLTPQQQQYYRQQFLAERQRHQQLQARQQAALRQQQNQRPQMMQGPQQAPQQFAPMMGPQRAPIAAAPQPTAQMPMPQQSLYGSLHDDLTKDFTPVSRPKTAPDNLNNPDAPVSTSRAVPAEPVETAPLRKPVIAGLAGGQ